jgi:hypothetical protein
MIGSPSCCCAFKSAASCAAYQHSPSAAAVCRIETAVCLTPPSCVCAPRTYTLLSRLSFALHFFRLSIS